MHAWYTLRSLNEYFSDHELFSLVVVFFFLHKIVQSFFIILNFGI